MTILFYCLIVIFAALLGAGFGALFHYVRADMPNPEKLYDNDLMNELVIEDHWFEKYIVGAKWDENGYWDGRSIRNLLYYVISSGGFPLLLGLILWPKREGIVGAVCGQLTNWGAHPPLCG
jgi:hypothetical protein